MIFGALVGLIFGGLFRLFLKAFLSLFNPKFKKEQGKETIRYAVETGLLFLVPFATMLLVVVFILGWGMTMSFISTGIMAVGTAAAIEMGKLKHKQELKNTIATAGVCFLFSFIWTLSQPILYKVPPYIEGGIGLVRSLLL